MLKVSRKVWTLQYEKEGFHFLPVKDNYFALQEHYYARYVLSFTPHPRDRRQASDGVICISPKFLSLMKVSMSLISSFASDSLMSNV